MASVMITGSGAVVTGKRKKIQNRIPKSFIANLLNLTSKSNVHHCNKSFVLCRCKYASINIQKSHDETQIRTETNMNGKTVLFNLNKF